MRSWLGRCLNKEFDSYVKKNQNFMIFLDITLFLRVFYRKGGEMDETQSGSRTVKMEELEK